MGFFFFFLRVLSVLRGKNPFRVAKSPFGKPHMRADARAYPRVHRVRGNPANDLPSRRWGARQGAKSSTAPGRCSTPIGVHMGIVSYQGWRPPSAALPLADGYNAFGVRLVPRCSRFRDEPSVSGAEINT
jgi:hypothetical protein